MTNQTLPGLGRIEAPDPRDLPFSIEARLLPPIPVHRVTKHWALFRTPLDQGSEGTCVGHGWRHWLQAAPVIQTKKYPSAVQIYDWCTQVDEWQQNDNYDRSFGTSVRSGGKVLKSYGLLSEYNMTSDTRTMADWIGGKDAGGKFLGGPLVIGANWHQGMFNTNTEGFIKPTGPVLGGHCVCLLGWNEKQAVFYGVNSWGTRWGIKGRFKISAEDMYQLMIEGGEAWTAREVRLV